MVEEIGLETFTETNQNENGIEGIRIFSGIDSFAWVLLYNSGLLWSSHSRICLLNLTGTLIIRQ